MQATTVSDVRPSPIAGSWYPGRPERLAEMVGQFLQAAPQANFSGRPIALVAPHAGYIYSGRVAGCAFKQIEGHRYERVFVISPMHHSYYQPVLTTAHEAYGTPLGNIVVDQETMKALGQKVDITPIKRDPEHSLEIELPFLQQALDGAFKLAPIMLRDQSYEMAAQVGEAIAEVIGESEESTLLVASSDLSHFYTEAQAQQYDQVMLERVAALDAEGVIRVDEEERGFACGRAAIAAALVAARRLGADKAQITGYGTSAESSGDSMRVVGYGAAVIYQTK